MSFHCVEEAQPNVVHIFNHGINCLYAYNNGRDSVTYTFVISVVLLLRETIIVRYTNKVYGKQIDRIGICIKNLTFYEENKQGVIDLDARH